MVHSALLIIKALILAKNLLTKALKILILPLKIIFRLIFSKILVKFYYWIFKLRKSGFLQSGPNKIPISKLRHFLLFALIIFIFILNFTNNSSAKNAQDDLYKTILAQIIPNEFGDISSQVLIKDESAPVLESVQSNKYLGDGSAIKDDNQVAPIAKNDGNYLALTPDSDAIIKPPFLGHDSPTSNVVISTPNRKEITYYTVGPGDTVSTIARKFNISVNTILWANNLNAFSLIRPGDELTILPTSGTLHTIVKGDTLSRIAQNYGVSENQIVAGNNLGPHLIIGQKIIVPGGKKITTTAVASKPSTPSYSGAQAITKLVTPATPQAPSNKMQWPADAYRITQYFSWRHPGLDIAAKVGTPIYAADSGVVVTSQGGWNGGYGNTILIDHGGGKKTRYGHMSKLFVSVGDTVEKGEHIAAMGSTGRSTGSHLHFEVIINGTKYNPLTYIK